MAAMKTARLALAFLVIALSWQLQAAELCRLKSPDGLNVLSMSLSDRGRPAYRIERRGRVLMADSPLGLHCESGDFTTQMTLQKIGPRQLRHEHYQLLVGNQVSLDNSLWAQSVTLKNAGGDAVRLDLVAGNEGVGLRYVLEDDDGLPRTVIRELTGFRVPPTAEAWMQPYHAAGPYTPAYEDFYFRVSPGDSPPHSRARSRGWCLPGLFHLAAPKAWMLIAESDVDGGYCVSHLEETSSKGLYQITFAYADEMTGAKQFDADAKPASVIASKTPWRIIVMADEPGEILNSTLVTDLAGPSRIQDTSWIKPGRASWSWWSHPNGPDTTEFFNRYTDLAADFGWEYTLFDAGWWNADLAAMCRHANQTNVRPLVWVHANDFLTEARRTSKLDEMVRSGAKGVKVDFWCSDRQDTMAAIQALLKDAADRKLVVGLHGCTIPRGWHRTWPNLLTAEAVLGLESYFYESRYPDRTAEQNTILPFTRNVLAPMDTTPFGLTIRKYPRKTTAVHELAAAIIVNSGIIHYADSAEVYRELPDEVQRLLRDAPAAWEQTECLIGEPGKQVALARRAGDRWVIAGLNGTDRSMPVSLDLKAIAPFDGGCQITEGTDPLIQFSAAPITDTAFWRHQIPAYGGFVLVLVNGVP